MSDNNQNNQEHWHIRKEVTWGHIVSTIILAGSLVGVFMTVDDRIDANKSGMHEIKTEVKYVRQLNLVQDQNLENAIRRIEDQYEKIDSKLDALRQELRKR